MNAFDERVLSDDAVTDLSRVVLDRLRETVALELREQPELADLGFGEDYELLAAVAEQTRFPVVGRCEEGEGVVLTLNGEPCELAGWEHFR